MDNQALIDNIGSITKMSDSEKLTIIALVLTNIMIGIDRQTELLDKISMSNNL